jgi:hypothetical protein
MTNNTQPEALRLSELLETDGWPDAAAELRRLHEVNQALLKTLESYEAENEQLWGFVKGFIQSVKAKEQI